MSELIHEGKTCEQIITETFDDALILSHQDIRFECRCSKEHMKEALMTLTPEERKKMIEEDHGCEIICHWCDTRYQFSEAELRELEYEDR